MIFLKQIYSAIIEFFIEIWESIRDFHICTGEWKKREFIEQGGGMWGFKKCTRWSTVHTKTCTICGKTKKYYTHETDWDFNKPW